MAQAHVDPEKLRKFSRQLRGFADFTDATMRRLGGEISRLGNTWRDQEFDRFVREFTRVQAQLKKFVEEARSTAPKIDEDARLAEEYQHYHSSGS
jgi:uncharacterized protein YukE